jgi:transcriptional accessory protein Tex/SPT6
VIRGKMMKLCNLPFGETAMVIDEKSIYAGQILITTHFKAVIVIGIHRGCMINVEDHAELEVDPTEIIPA